MRAAAGVPEVRTARLLLRGWQESDVAPFAAINADPEVMKHFPERLDSEQSAAMVENMMSGWARNAFGLWAVERLDDGAFIGFVGLAAPSWQSTFTPCVEVGWRLARDQWGQGFAPEAATAALAFGFAAVSLPGDEIVSFTTKQNTNSQRVMQKIGMRLDPSREFDHPLTPGWAEQRHVLYAIDRAGWLAGMAR